jgi:hypothetical protein
MVVSLKERNKQALDNISQLQQQEKELYASLEDVNLTIDQKQQIIHKINEIAQIRMNIYGTLRDMYANYQENVEVAQDNYEQSKIAIDILEDELNEAKRKMNLIRDEKYNKLRLVEINTYYGKRYDAHAKIMKIIVLTCIPIILLSVLHSKLFLPDSIYGGLVALTFVVGGVFLGIQVLDILNRDPMNWDEYNWYFDKNNAPPQDTAANSEPADNPWEANVVPCVGSACCVEGTTYDSTQNICILNEVS